jgi:nucleoside-diphosphate-sugar epimerase
LTFCSFVIGPPLIAPKDPSQVNETNLAIWTIFSGAPLPAPFAGLSQVVDVRDVAALLVYAVEHPEETNGGRYIASSSIYSVQAYADILRKAFPDAQNRIVEGEPGKGYPKNFQPDPTKDALVDSSKAEKLLASQGGWTSFEKSVVDTAKAFEGLL